MYSKVPEWDGQEKQIYGKWKCPQVIYKNSCNEAKNLNLIFLCPNDLRAELDTFVKSAAQQLRVGWTNWVKFDGYFDNNKYEMREKDVFWKCQRDWSLLSIKKKKKVHFTVKIIR